MKIRKGFVSNSSSSSFVFAGRPVKASSITENQIYKNEFIVIGKSLCEGLDIFNISTLSILNFLKCQKI